MTMKKKFERRTALVLGGGGSRGAYEIGAWQALRELDFTFDMVYGTSIGAINGAMIVQGDFEKTISLWRELNTSDVFELESQSDLENLLELITKKGGTLSCLQGILDNYLNEETLRTSSTDFGVVTVELPDLPQQLNLTSLKECILKPLYLTKKQIPQGRLTDFICASASCFPVIQLFEIDGKKYMDGGYADNVPIGMAIDNGASDIISINLHSLGLNPSNGKEKHLRITEIGSKWDLGNFMLFKRDNIEKIIRLGYLEAMKSFHKYHGDYYTFSKDDFLVEDIQLLDRAAKIFDMDSGIIYERETFTKGLKDAVEGHVSANRENNTNTATTTSGVLFDKILPSHGLSLVEKFLKTIGKIKSEFGSASLTLALAKEISRDSEKKSLKDNPAIALLIKDELEVAQYLVEKNIYN